MMPFTGDYFFYALFILMIPAIALGLSGRPLKYYGLFVTLVFVTLIYGGAAQLMRAAGFWLYSLVVAIVYSMLPTRKRMAAFWIFLALSLMPLIISKSVPRIEFFHFLGISYMTFRTIQFIIGIKEGKLEKINVFEHAYFVLFFPSLSSGPIDRLARFRGDIAARYSSKEYLELLREGIWKFANGVLYGIVLAPAVNELLLTRADAMDGGLGLAVYAYSYTIFLFLNFAGYSYMAVGAAYILGIKMASNFNMPFAAHDLKDFWARWHISLSTFFRDYIYNKFVMLVLKKKTFKNPRAGSYIGYGITMMTMGLWHGLNLRFIIYGAYHGGLMCVNEYMDNNLKGFRQFKNSRWGSLICAFVTFHAVTFGLLIFSGKLF